MRDSVTCNNGIRDLNENGIDCGPECPENCAPDMTGMLLILFGIIILVSMSVMVKIKSY